MAAPIIEVRQPTSYEDADPARIGEMMRLLDPNFPNTPMPQYRFDRYDGTHNALIVAYIGGRAVGTASMASVEEPAINYGFLGAFVTHGDSQKQGVATALWQGVLEWCRQMDHPFFLLQTEPWREDAIRFYERMGAVLLDSNEHLTYQVSA